MPANRPHPALDRAFVRRTAFVFAVGAALFLAWRLASVLLLLFGAVVVAAVFRSLAAPIQHRTGLSEKLSLTLAVLIVLAVLVACGWLFGAVLASQLQDLAGRLPTSMAELQALARTLPFGDQIAARLEDASDLSAQFGGLAGKIGGYAVSVAGALTNLVLVLFAAIFIAVAPDRTRDGLALMFPPGPREAVVEALNASGSALRLWVLGMFVDMLAVGLMTGLGAWLIGLPSPFALGAIAALANIVPFVGPAASIVPGLLVAIPQGGDLWIWTLAMYIAVQQIEGNLIYPFIQRRAVNLPPVLTLAGVLVFGVLFGPLGVVLAAPLLVVSFTLVKVLYLRNTLGEAVKLPGHAA
jgi:predicted PurR-regulated permease PerM